jgi:hypothetical protein
MPEILTSLTALAVAVFRDRNENYEQKNSWMDNILIGDSLLREAQGESLIITAKYPAINDVANLVFSLPELLPLAPKEGELDPMLMHPGGGIRMSASSIVAGIISSAILQTYFLRLPKEESTFVRTVIEGFEELRRAARGERIRAYSISGISHVTMSEGSQINTPWGIVRPAPAVKTERFIPSFAQSNATCLLAEQILLPIKFDRSRDPERSFDQSDSISDRSRILFPLACALGSKETAKPIVPILTWSTLLLPFQVGFGFSMPLPSPKFGPDENISDSKDDIEEWARKIDRSHSSSVDVAARRLVSAVANRMDKTDSLIDAVMVWENLVGTKTEVTFRVTAALAKLLESEPSKRRVLRKQLADIYEIRSRVVHGDSVETSRINQVYSDAIGVAVRALRVCYERGREWLELSSNERADTILLEWQ